MTWLSWKRSVLIVDNGRANAIIVIPTDADNQLMEGANFLSEYVWKSTKVKLPIKYVTELEPSDQELTHIMIGDIRSIENGNVKKELREIDEDGFLIEVQDKIITILGGTPYGAQFGVYEFLERYVGVSWLMPGPDGEDVIARSSLSIPYVKIREEPAYQSRVLFGLQLSELIIQDNGPNYTWGIRNRLHQRISGYQHHMWSLFLPQKGLPSEKYPITHPEFYPLRNGERFIPTTQIGWQPCFSEPGTITAAIDTIVDFFNNHPEISSFSLAINDNGGFCETELDHPKNPHRLNSIGEPDMSEIYYAWVNRVVEGVLKVHPDKWFGLLAYGSVMDPPSFKLNSRIIPYFTKDRMGWIDDRVREKDQQQIQAWNRVSSQLAYYDYIYGTPYKLPRFYPHQMAEYLKYGEEQEVIAYFGELYPNWGEGPKAWVIAKLLWDPGRNVDELLNFWYEHAVGKDAAPALRAYFDHWEEFWTTRIKETEWFQEGKDLTYFLFHSDSYLESLSEEEMKEMRSLLESVVARTETAQQKSRAMILMKQFEYYEASVLSYPRAIQQPVDTNTAMNLLDHVLSGRTQADYARKKQDLIEQYRTDPNHALLEHMTGSVMTQEEQQENSFVEFSLVVDYLNTYETKGGPVYDMLIQSAAGQDTMARERANHILKVVRIDP
ncbi:DUF4838 domain-containing protein [Paenibacillus terrigena]|uniref:DUF4838 domain-containing protein n=1 Tax=Paenibacillus terrigena TaxID=369333 RepID=UPI00039B9D0B|nr:DUF4838 domain-containing protein [Paenibacillus terrigena]